MDKQIVTFNGQQLIVPDATYGGAVNSKHTLTGVRAFVASKAGIVLPEPTMGKDGKKHGLTFKEVKDLIKAQGGSDGQIKIWQKEYDAHRSDYLSVGKKMAALAAADPSMRNVTKPVFSQKGELLGCNTASRFVKQPKVVAAKDDLIRRLTAQVEALTLRLGAPAQA